MFREIRHTKQKLSEKDSITILAESTSGVLSLIGDGGYPYGVPLSYVYHDFKLYFHGIGAGYKIDAIKNCDKASFCVIDKDQVVPQELTTYYRSVIVFGKVRILKEETEKRKVLLYLTKKYAPDKEDHVNDYIGKQLSKVCVIEFDMEHITGKTAIELV